MINLDLAFVFQLVNFLVLVLLLNVFLYKPIRKHLADRAAQISGAKEKSAAVDKEVQEIVADAEVVERLRGIAFEPRRMAPDEIRPFIKSEIEKWGRLSKAAGIEKE